MTNTTTPKAEMLFATPVMKIMVENAPQLNESFKTKIYARQKVDAGHNKSNFGGWHSNDDMVMWATDEARTIINTAIDTCSQFTADVHPNGKRNFRFDVNMWTNINQKGDSNNAHTHPGALWSCVYYVDDGADGISTNVGGELMLEDPRFPMNVMYTPNLLLKNTDGSVQYAQHTVIPKTGMMVIFPSWLRHNVRPYLGNKDRISIAFNLMVKELDDT